MYVADESNYEVQTEDYNNNNPEPKKKKNNNKTMAIIKVILVALTIGVLVYLVSSLFFIKKQAPQKNDSEEKLDIKSSEVKQLYSYIAYSDNFRNDKFIKNKSVRLENLSNYDKFSCALSFATKDDFNKVDKDENNNIYYIDSDTIKLYMKRFFGSKVSYQKESISIPFVFNFNINNKNKVTLSYDKTLDGYKGNFNDYVETEKNEVIKPYYYEITSATKDENNTVTIKENIIYLTKEVIKDASGNDTDKYNYSVFKDFEHTMLIEKVENVDKKTLEESPISIKKYGKQATTITYVFKYDTPNGYYFYSSKIDN